MKKIILAIASYLIMCNLALANTDNQTFSIYVTNNTSYAINLLNSNYNVSPINYITQTVTPGVQQLKIGTVKETDGKFNISFFTHIGNEEMVYSNSPLITYYYNNSEVSLSIEPATASMLGRNYTINVQPAKSIDQNIDSILVTIDNA